MDYSGCAGCATQAIWHYLYFTFALRVAYRRCQTLHVDKQKFRTALGAILRDARDAQRITRPELAERVNEGLSRATIARYEAGERGIPVDVFTTWCEALELDALTVVAEALDAAESASPDAE